MASVQPILDTDTNPNRRRAGGGWRVKILSHFLAPYSTYKQTYIVPTTFFSIFKKETKIYVWEPTADVWERTAGVWEPKPGRTGCMGTGFPRVPTEFNPCC